MHRLDVSDPDGLLSLIAEHLGLTLVEWRATHSEPARKGNMLGFEVVLESPQGEKQTHTIFVETDPATDPPDGVLVFEQPDTGSRIGVWVYPNDPALPALAPTVFSESASVLLARLGVAIAEPTLTVLAYRPGKRAVIRVEGGPERLYLKVVRPGKANSIVERHTAFLNAGVTVPRIVGWSEEGLIALTELTGVEAQKSPTSLDEAFLDRVRELSEQVATVPSTERARESLVDRLDWYRSRLTRLQPESAELLARLTDGIRQLLSEGRSGEVALETIHGDLHAGQIFIANNPDAPNGELMITGLLDIDTAGLGDPADDSAAFYAHLLVLAGHLRDAGKRDTANHIEALAATWRSRWMRDGDPGFVARARAISATHLLGHALRQRPEGVSRMLDLADRIVSGEPVT